MTGSAVCECPFRVAKVNFRPLSVPGGTDRSRTYYGRPRVDVYFRTRSGRLRGLEADDAFRQGPAKSGPRQWPLDFRGSGC